MVKRKISKKALKKPDEFISITSGVFKFIMENAQQTGIVVAILVALGSVILLVNLYQKQQEKKANLLLAQGIGLYRKAELEKKDEILKNAMDILNQLIEKHNNSKAVQYAYFYKGNSYYQLKEFKEAVNAYEKLLNNNSIKNQGIKEITLLVLAKSYESMNNFEKAIENYEKYRDLFKDNARDGEEAYEGIARCYKLLGNKDKAIETYKLALEKYKDNKELHNIFKEKLDILNKADK